MIALHYKTKKALKESKGKTLNYSETSMFGNECFPNKMLTGVGPSAYERKWYANVWVDDNYKIIKVK